MVFISKSLAYFLPARFDLRTLSRASPTLPRSACVVSDSVSVLCTTPHPSVRELHATPRR